MKKSSRIIRGTGIAIAAAVLWGLAAAVASATPSTQIWIPSTDIQGFLVPHLNSDIYVHVQPGPTGYQAPLYMRFGARLAF